MKTVTIDNLAESTEQEVFDFISNHLLNQARRAADEKGMCLYKAKNGDKCAAGCLIGDKYKPEMEGMGWRSVVHEFDFPAIHSNLISQMQTIHDSFLVTDWEYDIKIVAERNELCFISANP